MAIEQKTKKNNAEIDSSGKACIHILQVFGMQEKSLSHNQHYVIILYNDAKRMFSFLFLTRFQKTRPSLYLC